MHTAPPRADFSDLFRLFDEFPTGVVVLDGQGTIQRINRTASERMGRAEGELVGVSFVREAIPELEEAGIGERYRRAMAAGKVAFEWDGSTLSPRGPLHLWLGFRSFTLDDARWGIVVLEDRSAIREEEVRRKRAERLAAVGELAAGVAHEVNNPLASIRSFAQLLARDATTTDQRRALEIIIQESSRIGRAMENLLTFARQQGGTGKEPVNLSTVAARVLELQKYTLETGGVEVLQDLVLALSSVMGELGALQQVVLNLVTNAEQALAGKEGHRLLVVRTRESSEGVTLSVVDNGPGIPREELPRIFETLGGSNGRGLGLGVAAAIIRDHGGQIMAESEEGRGTAFFVRLPRAAAPPAPAPPVKAPAEPKATPTRVLRILVADDEPTLRLAIALFLGRRGHQVTQASDAYEALRLAQEQEFDVALVDARMPGDGLQLLEQLEAMPALRGRTALMTGDLGRARTSQGLASGRPYLVKPFDMSEAVDLIERLGR